MFFKPKKESLETNKVLTFDVGESLEEVEAKLVVRDCNCQLCGKRLATLENPGCASREKIEAYEEAISSFHRKVVTTGIEDYPDAVWCLCSNCYKDLLIRINDFILFKRTVENEEK